ncbi:ATP-dependent protease subunit HslV [Botrimarina colliarenosi]|uniref:ATP-dependent protease subunit HslV n=1 Tax=Botrimarina colliarenosi TaxID=2528001 RepID=A0A5C6A6C4_9BACT|nr:MFS transporter [Botrimarina colliarenosi]TWT94828.1 ATP-dependent protease subunit HslV [Botrimarina colliarenosi]
MSTIVAIRKKDRAVIAADTQVSEGSTLVSSEMLRSPTKIHAIGGGYMGIVGSVAHHRVIRSLATEKADYFNFESADALFETLRRIHPILRDEYYLLTSEKDSDSQPYESNHMTGLVVSPAGVFSFDTYREVSEYHSFWAVGSGGDYALGALAAIYDSSESVEAVAEAAVTAACRFDSGSGLPIELRSVRLQQQ